MIELKRDFYSAAIEQTKHCIRYLIDPRVELIDLISRDQIVAAEHAAGRHTLRAPKVANAPDGGHKIIVAGGTTFQLGCKYLRACHDLMEIFDAQTAVWAQTSEKSEPPLGMTYVIVPA